MKRVLNVVGILVLAGMLANSAAAQDLKREKSQCTVRDSAGLIRVVICPAALDAEALRAAGEEACGITVLCSAWIWDDADKAPNQLPDDDLEVDPRYARNAVAVWFNDSKGLMMIRRDAE